MTSLSVLARSHMSTSTSKRSGTTFVWVCQHTLHHPDTRHPPLLLLTLTATSIPLQVPWYTHPHPPLPSRPWMTRRSASPLSSPTCARLMARWTPEVAGGARSGPVPQAGTVCGNETVEPAAEAGAVGWVWRGGGSAAAAAAARCVVWGGKGQGYDAPYMH